jgi:hypothetical protein
VIGHVSKAHHNLGMNVVMAIVPEDSDGGLTFWPESSTGSLIFEGWGRVPITQEGQLTALFPGLLATFCLEKVDRANGVLAEFHRTIYRTAFFENRGSLSWAKPLKTGH